METNKEKLLKLTELRYKHLILLLDNLSGKKDNNPVGEIVNIHLISEFILEELIKISVGKSADAILSCDLTYNQKLTIAGKLEIIEGVSLIPNYIIGSLRKLNKLRNKVAHTLNVQIADNEIKELFIGLELEHLYIENIMENGQLSALKQYLAFIFGNMLPKLEENNNEA